MSVPYTCKEAEQAILNTAELEYCEFLEDLTLETETPGTTRDKCLKRYGLIFCMKLIKTGEKKRGDYFDAARAGVTFLGGPS